jgi:hypothetical protein
LKTAESSYLTPLNSEEKNQIKLIFQKDSWWWGEGGGRDICIYLYLQQFFSYDYRYHTYWGRTAETGIMN